MNNQPVQIYIESNPNPNTMKFVADYMVFPEGLIFDFPDVESTATSPLARELYKFPYVESVFFMNNFITISKEENVEWEEIKRELKDFIADYLDNNKPLFDEEIKKEKVSSAPSEEDPELVKKIKNVLEEYVKPAVEMDGGAIVFDSYQNGTVKVLLQGSCSGCPSSTITLKAGIENLLTTMIPEVTSVEATGE